MWEPPAIWPGIGLAITLLVQLSLFREIGVAVGVLVEHMISFMSDL